MVGDAAETSISLNSCDISCQLTWSGLASASGISLRILVFCKPNEVLVAKGCFGKQQDTPTAPTAAGI